MCWRSTWSGRCRYLRRRRRRALAGRRKVLQDLGEHPDGGPVQVLDGRYGPYVKYGKVNATIPKDMDPADVTLEQAVEMIAQKAASKKGKQAARKKKSAAE